MTLEIMVIEEQIRRLERELDKLSGIPVFVPEELSNSKYLEHTPVHSGPEYLTVRASSWHDEMVTEFGVVHSLCKARDLAHSHGLKGITIVFGDSHDSETHARREVQRPNQVEVPSFGDSET